MFFVSLLLECIADADCESDDFFCGSGYPPYGSNYLESQASALPGEVILLQHSVMEFDGNETFVHLPAQYHPPLMKDISIFATVCQEPGNDGYIVGKGVNDLMRDFGLYLRSSRRTIWVAYGVAGLSSSNRFRDIIFFYNVSVADGNCHSIAVVLDDASNRGVLYIDGEVVGFKSPLRTSPTFRPGVRN